MRATVIAIDGDEITLSRRPEKNFWLDAKATAATLFPLLTALVWFTAMQRSPRPS